MSFREKNGKHIILTAAMFIITDLIPVIKKCLQPVPKWDPVGFHFSFQLKEDNAVSRYQFETRKSSRLWILHLTMLLSGALCATYQATYKDELTIGVCIRLLHISSTIVAAVIMCFQHYFAHEIVNFFNESLQFEERWLSSYLESEKEFWTRVKYGKFSSFALRFFRECYSFPTLNVAISAAAFPFSLWRQVPRDLLSQILNLNIWGASGIYIFDGLMRVASLLYTYSVMFLILNNFFILLTTSFILANCSMILMVIAIRRKLEKMSSHSHKVNGIVHMFREVQLLCSFYNDIHKLRVMPTYVLHWVLCSSVTLFTMVSRFVRDPLAALIFGNGLAMAFGTIILVYHLPVKLYVKDIR